MTDAGSTTGPIPPSATVRVRPARDRRNLSRARGSEPGSSVPPKTWLRGREKRRPDRLVGCKRLGFGRDRKAGER